MKENKNIDRLFQEKFKDFEIAPDDAVWNRISDSLPKKKKKRRVVALWWQIGGIAAAIALLLTVGISVFNSDDNNSDQFPVVNTDQNDTNPNSENSNNTIKTEQDKLKVNSTTIANSNSELEETPNTTNAINHHKATENQKASTIAEHSNSKSNNVVNTSKTKASSLAAQKRNKLAGSTITKDNTDKVASQTTSSSIIKTENKIQLKSETERKSAIKTAISNSENVVYEKHSSENQNSESTTSVTNKTENNDSEHSIDIDKTIEKESIVDAIAENNESINEEEKENEPSRWSVAPNVAPVYFNSFGKGSSIDMQFNDNAKSSDINMSYGIAGSYSISKKLKIRAGINRVNLNQSTSDVYAFTGAETAARGIEAEYKNITFNSNENHVSLMSTTMMNRSSIPEVFNTKTAGEIDQKFGFIEVPVELEYNVLDKKFGVNLIGGFSTFILNNNEIYADVNGTTTLIGEANNINTTSFSANFGLGMDYNVSKQWHINLEPTFKYQINTFSNTTGNFKPYFIGLYTGLSYKF
ncbi:hypothetical protein HNV08_00355 [Winogradskyella eckloniae]|uniref:hypothetical protein n=1 Tax=Winogradskyella eckloniae TaxID=1089306 RepID=UPI00156709B3|nr:hypothetical protein [Winogradskyella eckloniae]NRD18480.1 hypothetical protein [Winogradskyella eckloniae]